MKMQMERFFMDNVVQGKNRKLVTLYPFFQDCIEEKGKKESKSGSNGRMVNYITSKVS